MELVIPVTSDQLGKSPLMLSFSNYGSQSCFLYSDCTELHLSQMELHTIVLFVRVHFFVDHGRAQSN